MALHWIELHEVAHERLEQDVPKRLLERSFEVEVHQVAAAMGSAAADAGQERRRRDAQLVAQEQHEIFPLRLQRLLRLGVGPQMLGLEGLPPRHFASGVHGLAAQQPGGAVRGGDRLDAPVAEELAHDLHDDLCHAVGFAGATRAVQKEPATRDGTGSDREAIARLQGTQPARGQRVLPQLLHGLQHEERRQVLLLTAPHAGPRDQFHGGFQRRLRHLVAVQQARPGFALERSRRARGLLGGGAPSGVRRLPLLEQMCLAVFRVLLLQGAVLPQ